jgi:hypothetical protein
MATWRLAEPIRLRDTGYWDQPLLVVMTRIAPRALDDDNLASALKHLRDGIADALGYDDRDPRVRYRCAQRRGAVGEIGVEILIEPLLAAADAVGERGAV